ncbi:MAG: hypothetical protein KF824_04585 [Fimbriimonadaceae bacterium]|nr:MAG: hypothetical protein KF824_04585 [Fimbriimonadaceae bacterium]
MRKFFPLLALVCLVPGLASASPEPIASGYLEVAHGWVKRPDGSLVSIKGMMLPYKAWPITAKKIEPLKAKPNPNDALAYLLANPPSRQNDRGTNSSPKSAGPEADQTVYLADAGAAYGYVENNPSSLDDITLSGGLNKPWQTLRFGFATTLGTNPRFLIRWRIWQNNVDNPAPQNDFSGEIADFGVVWNQAIPSNQVIVEIGIAQAAVSTSDSTLFICQQFREYSNPPTTAQRNGEGEFMLGTVDTVFNTGAPPSVGSSDGTQFWYDWDPFPDGNYENTEIDTFEGAEANHVLGIKVAGSGSVVNLNSFAVRAVVGQSPQGNFLSTWQPNDNNRFTVLTSYDNMRSAPVGLIELDVPNASGNVTGIRASGVIWSSLGLHTAYIEMKNATNNTWVTLSTKTINEGDTIFAESYGGTIPLSNFVNPDGTITFRVRWQLSNAPVARNWRMGVDHFLVTYTIN